MTDDDFEANATASNELRTMVQALLSDYCDASVFECGKIRAKKKLANGYVVTFEIRQGRK